MQPGAHISLVTGWVADPGDVSECRLPPAQGRAPRCPPQPATTDPLRGSTATQLRLPYVARDYRRSRDWWTGPPDREPRSLGPATPPSGFDTPESEFHQSPAWTTPAIRSTHRLTGRFRSGPAPGERAAPRSFGEAGALALAEASPDGDPDRRERLAAAARWVRPVRGSGPRGIRRLAWARDRPARVHREGSGLGALLMARRERSWRAFRGAVKEVRRHVSRSPAV